MASLATGSAESTCCCTMIFKIERRRSLSASGALRVGSEFGGGDGRKLISILNKTASTRETGLLTSLNVSSCASSCQGLYAVVAEPPWHGGGVHQRWRVTPTWRHIGSTGQVEQRGRLPVQICLPNGTSRRLIS